MFDNIGEKIKGLGKFVCYTGIAISWIAYIIAVANDVELLFVGVLGAVAGSLLSWLGSLALVGFGEIIVRLTSIDEGLKNAGVTKYVQKPEYEYPANATEIYPGQTVPTQYAQQSADGCGVAQQSATVAPHTPDYSCLHIVVCNDYVDTGICQECYVHNVKRTFCHIKCESGTKEKRLCNHCIDEFKQNCGIL